MKTFEDVKKYIMSVELSTISDYQKDLDKPVGSSSADKAMHTLFQKKVQEAQHKIDNIDEVTTIEIGRQVNSLINLLTDYILRTRAGNLTSVDDREIRFMLDRYCLFLGITKEDLQCYKRADSGTDFGDAFRQRVNTIMGTNIPMAGVVEKAYREYENANEENKDQAYVTWKELQRDSGQLDGLLSDDQCYQEAKSRIHERSI